MDDFEFEISAIDPTIAEIAKYLPPLDKTRTGKVRIVKDVLRTGKIFPGNGKEIDITLSMLQQIHDEYKRFRAAGNASPLAWGSPIKTPGGQHNIEARNTICEIEDMVLCGERLFIAGYADIEAAKELCGKKLKVSVSVKSKFPDGKGNEYKSLMDHVAVVVHPVITDQLPAFQLSALAISPEIRQIVNQLLSLLDLPEIDGVIADEQFTVAVQAQIDTLKKVTGMDATELKAALDAALDAKLASVTASITNLTKKVEDREKQDLELALATRKASFTAALDEAFEAKRIDATKKEKLLAIGEKCGFDDMSLSLIPGDDPEDDGDEGDADLKRKSVQKPGKNQDGAKTPKGRNPLTGEEYELSCYTEEHLKAGFKGVRTDDLVPALKAKS